MSGRPQRRWYRHWYFIPVIGIGLCLALYGFIQTPWFKQQLVTVINQHLRQLTPSITVHGLQGHLPHSIRFEQIIMRDTQGPFVKMENIACTWSPLSWCTDTLVIPEIYTEKISVLRLPETEPLKVPPSTSKPSYPWPGFNIQKWTVDTISLDASITGKPILVAMEGDLSLDPNMGGAQTQLQLTGDINTDLHVAIQTATTLKDAGRFQLNVSTQSGPTTCQGQYIRDTNTVTISNLALERPGTRLTGDLQFDPRTRHAKGSLHVDSNTIEPITMLFGQAIQGQLTSEINLHVDQESQQCLQVFTVLKKLQGPTYAATELTTDIKIQDLWGTPQGELQGQIKQGHWKQTTLDHISLAVTGNMQAGQFDLQVTQEDPEALGFTSRAKWKRDKDIIIIEKPSLEASHGLNTIALAPAGSINVHYPKESKLHTAFRDLNLTVNQKRIQLEGHMDWDQQTNQLSSELDLQGDLHTHLTLNTSMPKQSRKTKADIHITRNEIPFDCSLQYLWSPNQVTIPDFDFYGDTILLEGTGIVHLSDLTVDAVLDVNATDLASLGQFLGTSLTGKANSHLDLTVAEDNSQHIRMTWDIKDIKTQGLQAHRLIGSAELQNLWQIPQGELTCSGSNLKWRQMTWNQVNIRGNANTNHMVLDAKGHGHWGQPIALETQATIGLNSNAPPLILTEARLDIGPETLQLQEPAVVLKLPQDNNSFRWSLQDWHWQASDTDFTITGWVSPLDLDVQARFKAQNMSALPLEGVDDFTGIVHTSLRCHGPLHSPHVSLQASINDFGPNTVVVTDVNRLNGTLLAELDEQGLQAELNLDTRANDFVQARFQQPMSFALWPPHWQSPNEAPQFQVKVDADMALFENLPIMRETLLGGRVQADLKYKGRFSGQAHWRQGYYEDILLGTIINDIQADFSAQDHTLQMTKFVGLSADKGHVHGTGRIDLDPALGYPFALNIQAQAFPWVDRADIIMATSGALQLKGTIQALTMNGAMVLDQGRLDLEALAPAPPPILSSISPHSQQTRSVKRVLSGDITLDLQDGFRIYGRGLESIWDGQIKLKHQGDIYEVTGKVIPRRGEFRILGRPFRLTEGSIILDGSWPIAPILDLTAIHSRSGIEAQVHISGRSTNPVVRIESDPPLPEDAILATVLFGRDLATITPMQAIQLGAALKSLHSPGGGLNVMRWTRQTIGVDTIEFRQDSENTNETSVAIGKYLKPEIYIEVQQPISRGGATSTHIEYEIRPNLTLETDAGPGIRPGIGINWKKDY